MLSKMAKITTIELIPNLVSDWGQIITKWRRNLSTGREVVIDVTNTISSGKVYVDIIRDDVLDKIIQQRENDIILDYYDGSVQNYGYGINKVTVKCCNQEDLSEDEKKELYRSIYKWDLVYREKSSDSESDSGSELDQAKIKRHQWICCGEQHVLIGGFNIKNY
tara:strand:- start:432 stop:923 length:492 start_codon:yes stop_codon:yes gene_type:complete